MKKKYIYILILSLSLALYFTYKWAKPKPIDWTESYSGFDKRPYGCFILQDLLPHLFSGKAINIRNKPIFTAAADEPAFQNSIFINRTFAPDSLEAIMLYDQVLGGKTIFIAAVSLEGELADTLNIKTDLSIDLKEVVADSMGLNFVNPSLRNDYPWYYPQTEAGYYISEFDTLNTVVLGTNSDSAVNFIKIEKGKGAFYIHSVPYIFTNYHMRVPEKAGYVFKALSYLPVASTVWDEYYKTGRMINRSPLRFIVSQHHLRWAWITALAGLILFLVFKARRRQRIIPILESPKNTTLEFVVTIGRLYHQNGSRKDIALKRITCLMEHIRQQLNLNTHNIDKKFMQQVSRRSGVDMETVESLFSLIASVQHSPDIGKNDLWQLNHQIETFYNKSLR